MCRWLAYVGSPIPLETVLVKPNHSLIDQSLLARDLFLPRNQLSSQFRGRAFPTNGDGFGIAWAGRDGTLGQYRQIEPAWDSQNLRSLAAQIESACFLAHVRAAPGGTIAEQNCHPFVHDGWMFQHNGEVNGFAALKRDLTFDVSPELYPAMLGNSDTETCFFLALSYGLADDPVAGLSRMVARVERARRERGVAEPFRATMCASDGERLVVLRWVSPAAAGTGAAEALESVAPSLFHSSGPITLHTSDEVSGGGPGGIETLPQDAQLVVSEPIELHWSRRTWHEVPAGTIGVIRPGEEPVFAPVDLGTS